MNLSRIYKNSDGFKPEPLQQREAMDGWQPSYPPEAHQHTDFAADENHFDCLPSPGERRAVHKISLPESSPDSSVEPPPQPTAEQVTVEEKQLHAETAPNPAPVIIPDGYVSREEAALEAEKAYSQGHESGLKEGKSIGYDAGCNETKTELEDNFLTASKSLLAACRELDSCRHNILKNGVNELQDFALAIAEQILRYSVKKHDQTIIATIEESLERAVKSKDFYIYLNPDDYETVAQKSEDLIAGVSGLETIFLKKDQKIEQGGVYMESDSCLVDATISSQFETILQAIEQQNSSTGE